ncbi:hypothetical protein [Clostridium estertheticum]|uniref:Uncharacterized protein n=1 Tax=Clostridium estertheticum TaxID=238834 RepID=A0AA47EG55_9CLOT|nr:hypothetical protein [Clostridium estertheticum]MBU3156326.1 hypothetical protein [Clostridium estertheticum]WAG59592.1 hypothetical protein LL038_18450 [Clostridium estertheticum]
MRELRIKEQKSICGGTMYQFTDLTTGWLYTDTNFYNLYCTRAAASKLHPTHAYSTITP